MTQTLSTNIKILLSLAMSLFIVACGTKKQIEPTPIPHPCAQEAQDILGTSWGGTGVGYAYAENEALRRATFDARNNLYSKYATCLDSIASLCKDLSMDSTATKLLLERKEGIVFSSQLVCNKIFDLNDGSIEVDVALQSPIESFKMWIIGLLDNNEKETLSTIIDSLLKINTEKTE